MPKVTKEYIENKKKQIIDAAYFLCLEKTVSTVTMQDIINKTGFSQGGIYRFYHDIDEIFKDMFMELRNRVSIKEKTDEIFAHAKEMSAAEVINQIFSMLADFMEEELMGIEKVDFEFSVLAMNAPERVEKILSGIPGVGNLEYLTMKTSAFFKEKMESGELKPRVNMEELLSYISSAYSGIQMCCIVNHCYKNLPFGENVRPKNQLNTLAKTVNYLMGVETE